jgi:hypothetical protein
MMAGGLSGRPDWDEAATIGSKDRTHVTAQGAKANGPPLPASWKAAQ